MKVKNPKSSDLNFYPLFVNVDSATYSSYLQTLYEPKKNDSPVKRRANNPPTQDRTASSFPSVLLIVRDLVDRYTLKCTNRVEDNDTALEAKA